MATKKTETVADEVAEVKEVDMWERVSIKLPLTRTEKDDVYVACNGRTYNIKRGVTVEVPRCVVEILQHSEEMQREAMEYEVSLSERTEELNNR